MYSKLLYCVGMVFMLVYALYYMIQLVSEPAIPAMQHFLALPWHWHLAGAVGFSLFTLATTLEPTKPHHKGG